MNISDCYSLLDIAEDADWKTVKKAYRTLAKKYHPDLNRGNPLLEARFKEIAQAYKALEEYYHKPRGYRGRDSQQRAKTRPASTSAKNREPKTAPPPEPEFNKTEPADDVPFSPADSRSPAEQWFQRLSDQIKDKLFEVERRILPLDVRKTVSIDFATASAGGAVRIRIATDEAFYVRIPAASSNRIEVAVPGKGAKSLVDRGRRGDLLLNIRVIPGDRAAPGTTNLFYDMSIPADEIAAGKVMTLNTIQGPIKFFVPKNTANGQTFVLKAKPDASRPINHVLTLHLV